MDSFWKAIETQLDILRRKGTSADLVCAILPPVPGVSSGDGFFGGGGGDYDVSEILFDLGWTFVWSEASYYWCMRAPDGSHITYVEGDLYKRNTKAQG